MSLDAAELRIAERDLPAPDPVTQPYWDGLLEGKLMVQRCTECGLAQFYPRALCGNCAGDIDWFEATGRGVVHTFTIVRFGFVEPYKSLLPYVIAMVKLDEGPLVLTNIVGSPVEDVRIGAKVRIEPIKAEDGLAVPFWVLEDK